MQHKPLTWSLKCGQKEKRGFGPRDMDRQTETERQGDRDRDTERDGESEEAESWISYAGKWLRADILSLWRTEQPTWVTKCSQYLYSKKHLNINRKKHFIPKGHGG